MPIYEYVCPKCNLKFELRCSFSESSEEAPCPNCQSSAKRVFSAFGISSVSEYGQHLARGGKPRSGVFDSKK
ncbi:MAG TPA: zinc ribbon domain-containing protein [Dehalococcoidia bacterium]|jgi:putative FmdB family regulatory protein|nr:zinc ribbon domain-containing protein [Dehalococcoidia bacterium]